MAAIQSHKPVDHETTTVYRNTTTTETSYNKANNERSFGNKMKEMANSATKLFHHGQNEPHAYKQQHEAAGYKAHQTGSTGISSNTTHATNNMQQPKKKKENLMTLCTGKKKKQEKVTLLGAAAKKEENHGAGGGGYLANMGEHVKRFAHKVDGGAAAGKKKKSKGHGGSSSSDESDNNRRDKHNKPTNKMIQKI